MFCLTRPPPHSNPLPTSSNKEEVKKGPFKLLLENFKEAGSGKENPPNMREPKISETAQHKVTVSLKECHLGSW